MSHRNYNAIDFATKLAATTSTPILILQTDGMGASSVRYSAIHGLDDEVKAELAENDLAFITFDTLEEADAAFFELVQNWETGPLSLTAVLGRPGQVAHVYEAIHGYEPELRFAA